MKKFYITTTLPYVNASPHVGFALEIIQADVIARAKRINGYEVFFNTGTDEHGLKIYEKALENELAPQEFCHTMVKRYESLKEELNLSFNNFIRTTDPHHIAAAQEFWRRAERNGDIYKKAYRAKYCVGCELVKTDSELEDGKCPLHPNRELKIIEEENYFFRFSKYQEPLLKFYREHSDFVVPEERYNEIKSFVSDGLKDFSISRLKEKMPWGVPVPGDEEHIMYVWFEALVSYISALGWPENKKEFEAFWPGMQVAGKDNLRQQTAMWQAMLMSAGLPNSKQVLIHGFITSGGQKISKSLGNVVDPVELVKKYRTDAVRYYLLREISPFKDGDFTYKRFEERYNADLANGLGNLLSRVLAMAENVFEGEVDCSPDDQFNKFLAETTKKADGFMGRYEFHRALETIWEIISFCDVYIEEKKPWETKDKRILKNLLAALLKIAVLLKPFLPNTSERMLGQLGAQEQKDGWRIKPKKGAALFAKLE